MKTVPRVMAMLLALASPAEAVTSSAAVPSRFSANGHNVSFDGRLFIGRDSSGWVAFVLRPEGITYRPDGLPAADGAMWSAPRAILPDPEAAENALAICETDHARAPYRCDTEGAAKADGDLDCYDVWLLDSDASQELDTGGLVMRRRRATFFIAQPRTRNAFLLKHRWEGGIELLSTSAGAQLTGIEPTVTRDGRLMVWNGIQASDRAVESLLYSTNPQPCALGGWSPPRSVSHMIADPTVNGRYRLGERPLRASDGSTLADGDPLPGAYPWLFPDGEAVIFISTNLPCRAEEDPPGCGPRRQMVTVVGYPTNWGVAPIDGGVNPDTDQTARLFFSSPGRDTFPGLPTTPGHDVWPFFGSNTRNYVEISFDDGLDGNYAGYWHMNEGVSREGFLDGRQAPDVSGYFNTAFVKGPRPPRDLLGGVRTYAGTVAGDSIAHDPSQSPTDHVTIEMAIRPTISPDCGPGDNWRMLLSKGNPGGGPLFVNFNDDRAVGARFVVEGGAEVWVGSPPLPIGVRSQVAASYDAPTGVATFYLNGTEVARTVSVPGRLLTTSTDPLVVGGTPWMPVTCPSAGGSFVGEIDDLDISNRRLTNGVTRAPANDGLLGRSVELDGNSGHLEVAHATSLSPINALTLEMAVRPASEPDCDGNNNFRSLLRKGTGYSITLEENRTFQGRVTVQGGATYSIVSPRQLPIGSWSRVGMTYDAATGELVTYVDGEITARASNPPALLQESTELLLIGGPATARGTCPDGEGGFHGGLDEVAISRVVRDLTKPLPVPTPPPPGPPPAPATDPGGCDCRVGGSSGEGVGALVLLLVPLLVVRRRRRLS